jgi:hypothetical protein
MPGLTDAPALSLVVVADDDAARALPDAPAEVLEVLLTDLELLEVVDLRLLVVPSAEVIFPLSDETPEVEFEVLMLV